MGKLVSFDHNIQVVHIGHLFRSSHHKEWRICSGQVKLDTFLEFFQNMSST